MSARLAVAQLPAQRRAIVAVDGIDGAGKTTFADALAPALDRPAVRASVDDFHRPRSALYSGRRAHAPPRRPSPVRTLRVRGQALYFAECEPRSRATLVLAW